MKNKTKLSDRIIDDAQLLWREPVVGDTVVLQVIGEPLHGWGSVRNGAVGIVMASGVDSLDRPYFLVDFQHHYRWKAAPKEIFPLDMECVPDIPVDWMYPTLLDKWLHIDHILDYLPHMCEDGDVRMIAFTDPTTGKVYKTKPGKFLKKFGCNDKLCQKFAQEWSATYVRTELKFSILTETADIVAAYLECGVEHTGVDNMLSSCMTHPTRWYSGIKSSDDSLHPTAVYGGESGVHLAVLRERNEIVARTLVYGEVYNRIYYKSSDYKESMYNMLKDRGYVQGDLTGATLNTVEAPNGSYILPYIDGDWGHCVDLDTFKVSEDGFDTHADGHYARGTTANSHDYTCECCGDGVNEDDVVWVGDYAYCCGACAEEDGYRYAVVDVYRSVREYDWVYDWVIVEGEYYSVEAINNGDIDVVYCEKTCEYKHGDEAIYVEYYNSYVPTDRAAEFDVVINSVGDYVHKDELEDDEDYEEVA